VKKDGKQSLNKRSQLDSIDQLLTHRAPRLFKKSNAMVAILVFIVMTLGFEVQPVNSQVFPGPSIVDDTYFTLTVYFEILTGFSAGM